MNARQKALLTRRLPGGVLKAVRSVVRLIEDLRKDIQDGTCVFCESPLTQTTRPRLICKHPDCARAYQRLYKHQRREAHK